VAADAEGNVKFLDLLGKRFIRQEHGHHDHGRAVAYSPDGKLIATGAERVLLWDALTMTKIAPLEYESVVWSVDFSPDARWLVSTHGDGSILIWDVLNRELRANLRQHSGGVRAVAFSPDGKRLVTASEDQSVILWNSENGRKEAVLTEHRTRVGAAIFAPDGRWIVSSDQSGILARHYLGESFARQLTRTPIGRPSYCLAVSPDGRFVATSFLVYDTVNGAPAFLPPLEWHAIYGAAFTPDGKLAVFVTDFGEVLIVDTSNWQLIERQRWTESPIVSLSISADGNRIVTGEDGKTVRLGTIRPLQQLGVIGQHSARVKAVAFSPDGKHVASAGDDKIVALWDVRRRKRVTTIGSHTSPIYALAFSPDGQRLVSGEHDRSVRQYRRHRSLWGFSLD
jgi:WD40 repeat protein